MDDRYLLNRSAATTRAISHSLLLSIIGFTSSILSLYNPTLMKSGVNVVDIRRYAIDRGIEFFSLK